MTLPSNGITPDVIREIMPPYRLDPDLLASTIAALPPPPPDATIAWRQTHLTRLLGEIAALKPADAAQGRIASSLLIVREMADTFAARTHAPGLDLNEMCRLSRTTTELLRSAAALERILARHQQMPVPFYGTVVQDEVDVPTLAALWGSGTPTVAEAGAGQPPATPERATLEPATLEPATGQPCPGALVPAVDPVAPRPAAVPTPAAAARPARRTAAPPAPPPPPDAASPAADDEPRPPATPRSPGHPPAETSAPRHRSSTPATRSVRPAGTSSEWVIEQLDQGPGWSREILRPRTAADPVACPGEGPGARPGEGRDHGAAPRSAAR